MIADSGHGDTFDALSTLALVKGALRLHLHMDAKQRWIADIRAGRWVFSGLGVSPQAATRDAVKAAGLWVARDPDKREEDARAR